MSWSIAELENTVKIPPACAKEIFEACGDEFWDSEEDVTSNGTLYFNSDHAEWMDYLGHNDKVVEILKKHKVEGGICFGSLEGDNAGSFWGYRFDGKGGMKELKGKILWEDKKEAFLGKKFVVTGTLKSMGRNEAEARIRDVKGIPSGNVSKNTDFLVVGEFPGEKKLQAAKKFGVLMLDEKQFLEMLG